MAKFRVHVFAQVDEPDLIGTHFSFVVDAKNADQTLDVAAAKIVGSTGLMEKRHGRGFNHITIRQEQDPLELTEEKN